MIRAFQIAVLCLLSFYLAGCPEPQEEPPVWNKVKIGDLAPYDDSSKPQTHLLKVMNLDVHIFEIPAENIGRLDKIRKTLFIRPLRLKDYRAFTANSFLVRFGQFQMLEEVLALLLAADGRKIAQVSLLLPDGQDETIVITGLDGPQTIFYTSIEGSKESAKVGPGILGLRIQSEKIPGAAGVSSVTAYPVFSLPIRSSIKKLTNRLKLREFPFTAAAFGLKMGPGDFVYLGPKEYVSDQTSLGGLFFSNPQGSLFLIKNKPPELKPAVRIFLLVCSRINY
jgi:hypothetical protein